MFGELSRFAAIATRQRWDPEAIDLAGDARAWPALAPARRARLRVLLCGFRIAEDAVAEHLSPFTGAAGSRPELARVLELQQADERRHARFFDRVAAEVLGLAGARDAPSARRDAARRLAPPGVLTLFEATLPALAAELAAGRAGLGDGLALYHATLEGVVFAAGQRALLAELAGGELPGVLAGVRRVELDERWHVGLGLRELGARAPDLDALSAAAISAADAWGEAVPEPIREEVVRLARRRIGVLERARR